MLLLLDFHDRLFFRRYKWFLFDSGSQVVQYNKGIFFSGHVELHIGSLLGITPKNLKNEAVMIGSSSGV